MSDFSGTIEAVAETPRKPEFAEIRNTFKSLMTSEADTFYRAFADAGEVISQDGEPDLDLYISSGGDMDLARRAKNAVMKRAPQDLVIIGGGKMNELQEEILDFLMSELDFKIHVLTKQGQIIQSITKQEGLPYLRGALRKVTLVDPLEMDTEKLKDLLRGLKIEAPLPISLSEIQSRVEHAWHYALLSRQYTPPQTPFRPSPHPPATTAAAAAVTPPAVAITPAADHSLAGL